MFLSKTFTTRHLSGLFEWPKWFVQKYDGRRDVWPDCATIRCGPDLDVGSEDRSRGADSGLPEDIQKVVPWSDEGIREISLYYIRPAGGTVRVRINEKEIDYMSPGVWVSRDAGS